MAFHSVVMVGASMDSGVDLRTWHGGTTDICQVRASHPGLRMLVSVVGMSVSCSLPHLLKPQPPRKAQNTGLKNYLPMSL